MANIFDVARFITDECGEMTAMKLQKLMYYSLAWHLVWDEQPLFTEEFEAWANGPVLQSLYDKHRNRFKVDSTLFAEGEPSNLSAAEKNNIRKVLKFYSEHTAQWLSNLTHQEAPWLETRGDLNPGDRSNRVISTASIFEYYSSL